jgi:hypothetical protein
VIFLLLYFWITLLPGAPINRQQGHKKYGEKCWRNLLIYLIIGDIIDTSLRGRRGNTYGVLGRKA